MSKQEQGLTQEREMFIKKEYFDLIKAGRKTKEVRLNIPQLSSLKTGDIIRFKRGQGDQLRVQIDAIKVYKSFADLQEAEYDNLSQIAPGITSWTEARIEAGQLFGDHNIRKYGILIIDFHKID